MARELNQQPFENNIFYCNTNSQDRDQKPSIHKDEKTSNQNATDITEIFIDVFCSLNSSSLDKRNILVIKLKINRNCIRHINSKTWAGNIVTTFFNNEQNYVVSLFLKKLPQSSKSMEIKTLFFPFQK